MIQVLGFQETITFTIQAFIKVTQTGIGNQAIISRWNENVGGSLPVIQEHI